MVWWRTLAVLAMFAGALSASAQVERVLPRKGSSSLAGTDFVISFMQNEVLDFGSDPRLQIFISSQFDAVVTIDYPLFGPQVRRIAAGTVFIETVSAYHVVNASEIAQYKAIFVRSDVPIVVYALNTLATSTDSYTAIPIKHLGTEYRTVNRPNDRYPINPDPDDVNPLDTMIRSSQFMVVAPYDNTNLEIVPTFRTERGSPANTVLNVTLQRGQCYVVRSAQTRIGTGDMSGSSIRSNFPVAVLTGNVRSSIPTDSVSSKDHLVEMIPPVPTWGRTYATTPFAMVYEGDVIRVMSADTNTDIEIITPTDTIYRYLANAGEWSDIRLAEPALYRSTKPFFVMQFMPSRQSSGSLDYDPAMVVVPPIEQYVEGALLLFPLLEVQEFLGSFQKFYHYVNLVAEEVSVSSLRVNSTLVKDIVPKFATQKIPGTNLHWAQVPLRPGSYTISADSGVFSGVMYGTTNADSYANLFGVAYEPVPRDDRSPPAYDLAVDCGNVIGTVTDIGKDTVLLSEATVQTQRTFNYRWTVSTPIDTFGTREVNAWVRDVWADGQFVIHAYDQKGNGKEWLYTYDAPKISVPTSIQVDANGSGQICEPVVIKNVDSTPVTIKAVLLNGDARLSIGTTISDTVVAAGDSITVLVCYTPTSNTAPAVGIVTVDLGCGRTRSISVRSLVLASLATRDHDFGPVRIGDTVCADIPIINIGSVPVVLTSWAPDTTLRIFTSTSSQLVLPDTLAPGDTIWVTVCFTPDTLRSYLRTDTLLTDPNLGLLTSWRGRGIRPDVPGMIVDWGRRRVGRVSDTLVALRNLGEADCQITLGTPANEPAAFTSTAFGTVLDVAGISLEDLQIRFVPQREGAFEDTVELKVDWRFHPRVRLIMRGVGTLPDVSAYDLNMGDVVVNTAKDSVAKLLETGGSEDLTITSIAVLGPDAASFIFPDTLRRLDILPIGSDISGLVRFSPLRLGQHRMAVVLEHDAAPDGERRTDTIHIIGNGIPIPVEQLDAEIDLAPVPACVLASIPIRLKNSGTTQIRIDSLRLRFTDRVMLVAGLPQVLGIGAEITLMADLVPERATAGPLTGEVYRNDTIIATLKGVLLVTTDAPIVTVTAPTVVSAGAQITVGITSASPWPRTVAEQLRFRVNVPRDRFLIQDGPIQAQIQDAVRGVINVAGLVSTDDRGAEIELLEPVTSVYRVEMGLSGMVLWKDPTPTKISVSALSTTCADADSAQTTYVVEECASGLRMVRFGAVPVVRSNIIEQPARSEISVQFAATAQTTVNVALVTVSGQRFMLAENFTLQKGISHCKFSCSGRATGYFNLVVTHGNGEEVLPVVIVN